MRRLGLASIAPLLAVLALAACTGDDGTPTPAPPEPTGTAALTPTAPPSARPPSPPGPWEVGESIDLALEPYAGATLSVVDAATVLPPRDQLDREGGPFVWDRSEDRLLFIDGLRYLYLAPGLVDGRPIGIALATHDEPREPRSLIVRFEPFEVAFLPAAFGVRGAPFHANWLEPTTVALTTSRATSVDGRTLPEGEYRLDLATRTLVLERASGQGRVGGPYVEEVWQTALGQRVALVVDRGRRVLGLGPTGGGEELAERVEQWALSPDGSKLLMVANRSELMVFDLELDRAMTLGRSAEYGAIGWSPDSRYFAATVFDTFEDTTRALVFDATDLEAVAFPPFGSSAADGLQLAPLEESWVWRWRDSTSLFIGSASSFVLLDVETGEQRVIVADRQPFDGMAWDATTSTLALSRAQGSPAAILELDGAGVWVDIALLAASPHVGLFDMNWGAEGQWLVLNTSPGRS